MTISGPAPTCPSCTAVAPVGARYCPNCAQPLSAGPPPTRAAASPWIKALVVVVAVAVVVAVVIVVLFAVGFHKATTNLAQALTPMPGRPAGYHGPAYPGMIQQDHVAAGPGASVEVAGQLLSAGNLKATAGLFGNTLCTPVTIANRSQTTTNVGPSDWKLQQPDGTVVTFALTGTLQTGQIAPGGRATGTVCFPDNTQNGTFVLLWQPLLQVARGVWLLPSG
jgi:hypothetical protein